MGEGTALHSLKPLSRSCSRTGPAALLAGGVLPPERRYSPSPQTCVNIEAVNEKRCVERLLAGLWQLEMSLYCCHRCRSPTIWQSVIRINIGFRKKRKKIDSIRYLCKYVFDFDEKILYPIIYHETHLNSSQCVLLTALTFAFPHRGQTGNGCRRQQAKVPEVQKSPGVSVCLLLHHPEFDIDTCG